MANPDLPPKRQSSQQLHQKWRNPTGTATYYAWRSMRYRCLNPKSQAWDNYGGRGIGVCDRWVDDYDAFFDDMGECPEGLSLERDDYQKGYSPQNCRWATMKEQQRNKRSNRLLTKDGKTQPMSQWAEDLGIGKDTLYRRLKNMPVERALTPGSIRRKANMTHGSRSMYERGCRCEQCRETHNARMRDQRKRRNAKLGK